MSLSAYRGFATLRIEALNHALRDIPPERVRFHVCWGSYHGPHKHDLPLREFVDLVLAVRAQGYSIEASNPRHDHEWRVGGGGARSARHDAISPVGGPARGLLSVPPPLAQRLAP